MRLLIKDKGSFLDESLDILRAGLETAGWVSVDDTAPGTRRVTAIALISAMTILPGSKPHTQKAD